MTPEDADLVLALEGHRFVRGVFALAGPHPSWPRIMIAMSVDDAYALGTITGIVVRALPHRDRSYVGVANEDRLRELWVPLTSPLVMSPRERAEARARAEVREREYAATQVVEVPPSSIPAVGPFAPGLVWTLANNRRVVVLDVVADPFRSAASSSSKSDRATMLVVAGDDNVYKSLLANATGRALVSRVVSVQAALESIRARAPDRIVCSEVLALGDGGLLDRIEAEHAELLPRLEILCASGHAADWLANFLATRIERVRVNVLEEPLEDELIEELIERSTTSKR